MDQNSKHEALIRRLIQHWGFSPDVEIHLEKVIGSDVAGHAPKYIFSVGPTRRFLFLGNAGSGWPSTTRVEARLSALERSALAHPSGFGPTALAHSVRTLSGAMVVVFQEVRYYLTSHVPGCTLAEAVSFDKEHFERYMLLLAAATGALHACSHAAGKGILPMDDAATFWSQLAVQCRSSFGDLAADPKSPLWKGKWTSTHGELARQARDVLTFIIEDSSNRLGRLSALPAIWNHGDLQMKNVMFDIDKETSMAAVSTDSSTLDVSSLPTGSLTVIDLTDGAYCSRLYDLYFLLAGGVDDAVDAGAVVDPSVVKNRFQAYFDGGGQPLSEEELLLLINACSIKGFGVAQYYALWSPKSEAPALFEQAVRAALSIGGDCKDAIRAAVKEAQSSRRQSK